MLRVMVMDFVVKAAVCAHLNIITKRTAPFMDVSYILMPTNFEAKNHLS